MTKRLASLILAIAMFLQIIAPQAIFAKEEVKAPKDGLVTVGVINGNSYDAKIMMELNRKTASSRKPRSAEPGVSLFSKGPYFGDKNEPKDENKPKYFGNISVDFKTSGLDGNDFQWKEIFGVDEKGNPKPAQIIFTQSDDETGDETGVEYILKVTQTGKHTWSDKNGKPTKLPLFSKTFKPYSYEVRVDEDVAENIKLLTARMTGTEGSNPTFLPENADGEIIANITLELGLQQVASTKFVSEWHTAVAENARPQIKGTIEEKDKELYPDPVAFDLPKNDTDVKIIRDWEDAFKDGLMVADALYKAPTVKLKETNENGLTFDTTKKTVKDSKNKYKYDFTYDVINGGKLTMTEIIPVIFEANGGKFKNVTAPDTDTKITKEVDYDGTLTDKAEDPKKDLETFKGWATAKDGTPLSKEDFEKAIKNIKTTKTFYAIWDNNDIEAKELTVHESYKNGDTYVNNFIPSLDDLKKQVQIKDANNSLKDLTGETFEILDDSDKAITGDALKNYLYGLLQEKDNPNGEPTRTEKVKAKITFANGKTKKVTVPIKVIKNIYEAKTEEGKPNYVPDDYVKVIVDPTTKAEKPQKYFYYVNPEAKVVIPGTDPTGTGDYTFEKWLIKGTATVYNLTQNPRTKFTAETTIEAQYVDNIIPAKTDGSKPDNVPTDFVLVEFKAGSSGKLQGTTKYWVNPTAGKKLSNLVYPSVNANTGFKHNGWDKDKDTAITEATEVTAQYLEKVLTQEPTQNKDKYVKVTFKQGDHGTIANGEQTQYWVLKQEEVNLKEPEVTPKTGYAHKTGDAAWSPKVAKYYYEDTEHVAQYKFNGEDVIPQTGNDKPTNVPDNYVLVEFNQGDHGVIDAGQTIKYWVNPKKEVTLTAPSITPNTGYRQQERLNAWDKYLTATFTKTTTITAKYEALGDILTEEKPGYVKVEFQAGKKGSLDGTTEYWVNPLKGKKLGDITHPSVKANDGWSHNGWDKTDDTAIDSNTTNPLVVTAKYLENVLTDDPYDTTNYVTVEFTKGAHGEIKTGETAKYWVLKDAEVSLTAPAVTPATGFAQKSGDDAWSPKQATKYSENTEHVAQYVYTGKDVVPAKPDGSKPDGTPDNFVQVTFESGENGTIDAGQTVKYWVNPDKEVTVNAPSVTAKQGYEQKPGFNAWDHYLTATFNTATTIKAQYNKLADILTEEKPGYVKVEFKKGDHGELDGTTVYWVNPAANKKLSDIRHPNVKAEDKFKHVGWDVPESKVIDNTVTSPLEVTAKYLEIVLTDEPSADIKNNYVKVTFDKGDHGTIEGTQTKVYWVLRNTEVSITAPTVTADTAKGFKQKDGKDAWSPEIARAYSQDTVHKAQYTYVGGDVIPQTGTEKPKNVPDDFVKVTFVPTEKAKDKDNKIYWVKPNVLLTIPVDKPEGKNVGVGEDNGNTQAYTWEFTKWVSTEQKPRTWDTNIDDGVKAIFTADVTINAEYRKVITDQGKVVADEITVHESFKDANGWVNDFIKKEATKTILEGAIKRIGANGQSEALPNDANIALLDDSGQPFANDEALKDALYEKLQEKDNPDDAPTRTETLKAKVTFQNSEVQTVEIPIKVIKNIYEAKTKEGKPNYVPAGYVKVTVDPTTKATEPQKFFYYVNPDAKVVIPGTDPTGTGDNKFVKWTYKDNGTETEYKLADKPRHTFTADTTIKAQYVSDVIEQDGPNKPDTVPSNFVKVTFVPTDKATDNTNKIFWVNPDKAVTIPVNNPVGKQYFTFKEWKIGDVTTGETYKVGTPKQFTDTNGTIITATYEEAKNIIPYNPNEPTTRPDGYVRITFKAETGLKLTEEKAYYVKKNAGITLKAIKDGTTNYGYPSYEAQTGYKFKEWDKKDDLVIEAADIVVTAEATPLDDTIEKIDDTIKKPKGYVEVKFVAGENGKLMKDQTEITDKTYYVNPNKYVTLTPPETKANTGFEFGSWDKDPKVPRQYTDIKGTTITASFNKLDDLIPEKKDDDSKNTKPDAYHTVTFEIEQVDSKDPAKFVKGEKLVYFVKPNTEVTITPPQYILETGYKFEKWDHDTTKPTAYTKDTVVKGKFTKIDDIIPSTDNQGNPNAKPDGYVKVVFISESEGKLKEGQKLIDQKIYYVNPKAKKQLGELTKPKVEPDTGYKQNEWAILGAINYKDDLEITDDLIVKAKYTALDDVVQKTKDDESEKPAGYITVKFSTETNGKIKGTDKTEKLVYVNPNKAVILDGQAPKVTPNTGFDFAGWDTQIDKKIQYSDGYTIKALYNEKGAVIPKINDQTKKPDGYVTVTFDKGANGELTGKTVYYVKPNTKVTVPAPDVKPNVGYAFEKWNQELTQTFAGDTTITAKYEPLEDKIPQANPDGSDRPDGYHTVKFKPDDNGTLSGTLVYYVKPNVDIDLTDTAKAITKNPNTGYTAEGGTWDPEITSKTYTDNAEYTFKFKALPDAIEKIDESTKKPDGYVTVTLIPTNKAKDEKNKVYYVNPTKEVTIPDNTPTGKEITDANENKYTYLFKEWTVTRGTITPSWEKGKQIIGTFTQDTDITAKYNVKAEKLVNGPIAKENVITLINVKPEAKDLIKNVYDPSKPDSQDNLPDGTIIEYAPNGEPKVNKAGDTTAKVKVTYPGGKTVIVEVPITVVDNVIPQEGEEKPNNVPKDFVKVTFVPTDKGTMEGAKIFWVKKATDVIIPVNDPVGVGYNIFNGWKFGVNADGDEFKKDEAKQFTLDETIITATYNDSKDIIPFDPNPKDGDPMVRPDGYVKVTFDADLGLKLGEAKAYYVKKNAGVKLSQLEKPKYKEANGYRFDKWDKDDATIITDQDIVVTAKAMLISSPSEPDYRPSRPEIIYKDKIVEKIVEKIVRVGENDELLKEIRYMQGFKGKFRPYDGLTRAEAAQILANALKADGYRYNANYALSYTDVGNVWYTDAIRVVTQANVFQGYSDGTFRPQGKITRAEWIATLRRFQDLKKASGNTMMLRSGHWATEEVEAAYQAGWLGVYQDGTAKFDADKPITRQEVAYVSNRAFRRVLDKVYLRRSVNTLLTYKDVNPSMPLYEDILCASNTLLTDGRYYKANTIVMDNVTFNIVTDEYKIYQKRFQFDISK